MFSTNQRQANDGLVMKSGSNIRRPKNFVIPRAVVDLNQYFFFVCHCIGLDAATTRSMTALLIPQLGVKRKRCVHTLALEGGTDDTPVRLGGGGNIHPERCE